MMWKSVVGFLGRVFNEVFVTRKKIPMKLKFILGAIPFLVFIIWWQSTALEAQERAWVEKKTSILEDVDAEEITAEEWAEAKVDAFDPKKPTLDMIWDAAVKYSTVKKADNGWPQIWSDSFTSMKTFTLGFILAFVGIILGVIFAGFSYFDALFKPLMIFAHKPSALALVPLLLAYIGSGFEMHVWLIVIGIAPTLMLITYSLIKSVPEQLIIAGMTLGYSDIENVFSIQLNYAKPRIIDGMLSVLNAVMLFLLAAEQIANQGGFGHTFYLTSRNFDIATIIVYNVLIGLYLSVINIALIGLRNKLYPWYNK